MQSLKFAQSPATLLPALAFGTSEATSKAHCCGSKLKGEAAMQSHGFDRFLGLSKSETGVVSLAPIT